MRRMSVRSGSVRALRSRSLEAARTKDEVRVERVDNSPNTAVPWCGDEALAMGYKEGKLSETLNVLAMFQRLHERREGYRPSGFYS